MLSEILIYEFTITKTVPFLKFFHKKEIEIYRLTYRIDEDRFWYYKIQNKKVVNDHLIKKNLSGSVNLMKEMQQRFIECDKHLKDKCQIKNFDLVDVNKNLYYQVSSYSQNKEEYYEKKKSNNNYSNGFLLDEVDF